MCIRDSSPVLALYALWTGIGSYFFVPFVLQYAQGQIRLHVIGNLLFALLWVPAAVFAAWRFGALGAGTVWLAGNVLFVLIWVPLTHRCLLAADERRGLGWPLLARVGLLGAGLAASRLIPVAGLDQIGSLALLAALSAAAFFAAVLAAGDLRREIVRVIKASDGGTARPVTLP